MEKFADWLCNLTVEREVAHGAGGGAGKAKIVLAGHSMGGLLAADTLLALYKSRVDETAPLWPNIIACIAYDTPYLGLHPGVFKYQADQAISYATDVVKSFGFFNAASQKATSSTALVPAQTAAKPAANGWARWAPAVGGALLAAGAAGAAYYRRDDLASGWQWGNDHLKYVGTLWDENALRARLDGVARTGVRFRNFYTILDTGDRTFCVLPKRGSRDASLWEPTKNRLAQDEVGAHVSMFNPKENDGYYDLGLRTAHIVREAMVAQSAQDSLQ